MKPNEILKLLKTCDELCISELIEDLQNHLIVEKNKWIQQNLAHVYEFSSQHQLSFGMLHDNCKDMIFGDLDLFFNTLDDDYRIIEKSTMISILKKDDIKIRNEINIWDYVIQWGITQMRSSVKEKEVEEKRNKRIKLIGLEKDISKWNKDNLAELKTLLEDMIPLIRFSLISANDFHEKILQHLMSE